MARGVLGVKKINIEEGHPRGTCDFCLKKGKTYRLRSNYREYRFLVVCPNCLKKIRKALKS